MIDEERAGRVVVVVVVQGAGLRFREATRVLRGACELIFWGQSTNCGQKGREVMVLRRQWSGFWS